MIENKVRQLRKLRKLTQRELAEKVGTSQQQIQRIEAAVVSARLELAARIAAALAVKIHEAFPKLAKSRTKSKKEKDFGGSESWESVGIDVDPLHWSIKLFMFDGRSFFYRISSDDKQRLERIVEHSKKQFLAFNSMTHAVAINRTKIAACQFLFDAGVVDDREEDRKYEMALHLISSKELIAFDLEPDTLTPIEDEGGGQSQLQSLMMDLDGADADTEEKVVWFDDVDGERVFIMSNEILALEIPLECCEPALTKAAMEGYEENENNFEQQSPEEGP